ncbi:MAG: hypothetical protein D6732_21095 [Methanobacteriota archaeon]|nr:MAG: hypothetical protein D6732_21095 [Euryarchaeota archaeon]
MKLVRSIHDNHRDLPAEAFWTRDEFKRLRAGKVDEWRLLTTRAVIRFGGRIETIEEFRGLLEQEWPHERYRYAGKLKRISQLLAITSELPHDALEREVNKFWEGLPEERKELPFAVYNTLTGPLNPFSGTKIGWRDFFRKKHVRKYRSIIRRLQPEFVLLRHLDSDMEQISDDDFEQSRIKPKEMERWKKKLRKVDLLGEDESVIGLGRLRLRRNHWKINSNFNRSGKYFFTPQRLVLVRRKFMLFGFSLAAFRPLEAFVRPANKVFVFVRMIYHYISEPLKAIFRARPAFGPAIAGIAVYFALLADQLGNLFRPLVDWWRIHVNLELPNIGVAIDFAIQNPEIVTGFAGMFAFIRLGFIKAFLRGEELVVLPFEKANYLLMERTMVFGRWKVKGCNIVGAPEGIEYKIMFFDQDMATKFFVAAMTHEKVEPETQISQEVPLDSSN